jgi:endonuclease YncB( thermonuclease family)
VAVALLAPVIAAGAGETCATDRIDARGEVRSVADGDTLVLADGRRIRLVGLNAPELGRDDRPAEPFATAARRALEDLAGPGRRIGLRFDAEREDPHGRTLAHVFLDDGTNVQRELLSRGLAASIVVPPNAWNWECYREAERGVRAAGRGIWGDARFRATEPARLPRAVEGFWIVSGRVTRVGEGRNAWWLNLDGGFSVRIERRNLASFPDLQPSALKGRRVEARGWVSASPKERWITVRHPAMLTVLEAGGR